MLGICASVLSVHLSVPLSLQVVPCSGVEVVVGGVAQKWEAGLALELSRDAHKPGQQTGLPGLSWWALAHAETRVRTHVWTRDLGQATSSLCSRLLPCGGVDDLASHGSAGASERMPGKHWGLGAPCSSLSPPAEMGGPNTTLGSGQKEDPALPQDERDRGCFAWGRCGHRKALGLGPKSNEEAVKEFRSRLLWEGRIRGNNTSNILP